MFVVGVDGCRDGWVLVALENGAFAGASQVASFDEVLAASEAADAIAVDVPITLIEQGERTCDRLVGEFIGQRRSSVFVAPPRMALQKATFEEATAECRKLAGFGMSRQLWNLKSKILDVEQALRATAPARQGRFVHHAQGAEDSTALRRHARVVPPSGEHLGASLLPAGRVIAVHPEASFRELAGAPLGSNKKTYDGLMRRMQLLEDAGISLPKKLAIGRVSLDDVLDAAGAAWTANRYAEGRARSLPDATAWQRIGSRIVTVWI